MMCIGFCYLQADVPEDLLKGVFAEGITVDLREPLFCEGVLTTEKGGIIAGPGIRIQARIIKYTRGKIEDQPVCKLEAEEDLLIEFGDYIFIGERLEYDFQTRTGLIYCARTGMAPWFLGGEVIRLCADGSYIVYHGFITTSEGRDVDWEIVAAEARLCDNRILEAKDVQFRFYNLPVFWLSSLNIDLDTIYDHPIRYTFGWGGKQGPRIGMAYEIFAVGRFQTFLRADYRIRRGPGIGIETRYRSEDHKEVLKTINYFARDSSIFIPNERWRYRFQGIYSRSLMDDRVSINLAYDKLSDRYMATDYADQGLEIEDFERTQLDIRRQEDNWISNFLVRPRINPFETVKQELPTLLTSWRPMTLGSSGIIVDNQVKASYLDFAYEHHTKRVHDYNSTRIALNHRLYRPFVCGPINVTPEAGGDLIFYGNSHGGKARWLTLGMLGCDINAPFYRSYEEGKHVITPYAQYQFLTFPTVTPKHHYIFDIEDGWYHLNMVRFGATQSFYIKDCAGNIRRFLFADIYSNAFIHTHTLPTFIPKTYARVVFNSSYTVKHTIETAWDFSQQQLDHFNWRTQWTINADLALAVEYRHRDAYDWRKADRDNFIIDSYRSVHELKHTQMSDKRDTALINIFYRFHPCWAVEFESRHGWNRRNHARYTEFEVDLLASLRSATQIKLTYQHRESEDRVAVYFSIGLQAPDRVKSSDLVPSLEF